jgi:hypothetical protein
VVHLPLPVAPEHLDLKSVLAGFVGQEIVAEEAGPDPVMRVLAALVSPFDGGVGDEADAGVGVDAGIDAGFALGQAAFLVWSGSQPARRRATRPHGGLQM